MQGCQSGILVFVRSQSTLSVGIPHGFIRLDLLLLQPKPYRPLSFFGLKAPEHFFLVGSDAWLSWGRKSAGACTLLQRRSATWHVRVRAGMFWVLGKGSRHLVRYCIITGIVAVRHEGFACKLAKLKCPDGGHSPMAQVAHSFPDCRVLPQHPPRSSAGIFLPEASKVFRAGDDLLPGLGFRV